MVSNKPQGPGLRGFLLLLHLGVHASLANSSLFIYKHGRILAYLLVYVDDIVLTSNNTIFLNILINQLSQALNSKN